MGLKSEFPMPVRIAYRNLRSVVQLPYYTIKSRRLGSDIQFMSNKETVDLIVERGMSIARYGDGEFNWVLGCEHASGYQTVSPELSIRLKEALTSTEPNLVIGVLKVLVDDSNMGLLAKSYWRKYKAQNMDAIASLLDPARTYADSSITRPYIDLKDRSGASAEFENLKRIWAGRDILLVEGDESRLGVGNDLFDAASSIRRVLCPSRNAFASYNAIMVATLDNVRESDLVLLALGPTATVLAYDLCRAGMQAVDIGHIDNEYEWMRMCAKKKCPIPGKAVDEAGSYGHAAPDDACYQGQVVARVS